MKIIINQEEFEIKPTICFDKNEIIISEDGLNPLLEIMDNPSDLIEHEIEYQDKEMSLESDTMLSLVFKQFLQEKKKRKEEITECEIEVETRNDIAMRRIRDTIQKIVKCEVDVNGMKDTSEQQRTNMEYIQERHSKYIEFKEAIEVAKRKIKEQGIEEKCPYIESMETNEEYERMDLSEIRYEMKEITNLPLWIKRNFNISTMDHYSMFIASRWFETLDDYISLEKGIRRFYGNMEKYFYNPVSIDERTKKFFPYLRTLCLYSSEDPLFEEDQRIIARVPCLKCELWPNEIKQIKKWSNLMCHSVMFDSECCDWKQKTSTFDKHIFNKEKMIFLIETEDNIKCGMFMSSKIDKYRYVDENGDVQGVVDPQSFVFTFRNNQPTKYMMKEEKKNESTCFLYQQDDARMISFGRRDLFIMKKGFGAFCQKRSYSPYDFKGVDGALTGKCGWGYNGKIGIKRVVVFQFE